MTVVPARVGVPEQTQRPRRFAAARRWLGRVMFAAGGASYRDTENRTWVDLTAAEAKVCFDPDDPAGVHRLVPGSYTCAGFNPFEDFGQ